MFFRDFFQGIYDNAGGEGGGRKVFVVEPVVDDKVECCAQVGYVAGESLVRIYGDVDSVEVQTVVGCKKCLHVGVFIMFNLLGGDADAFEIFKGLFAHSIHHVCTMSADEFAVLFVEPDVLFLAGGGRFVCCHIRYSSPASSLIQS